MYCLTTDSCCRNEISGIQVASKRERNCLPAAALLRKTGTYDFLGPFKEGVINKLSLS